MSWPLASPPAAWSPPGSTILGTVPVEQSRTTLTLSEYQLHLGLRLDALLEEAGEAEARRVVAASPFADLLGPKGKPTQNLGQAIAQRAMEYLSPAVDTTVFPTTLDGTINGFAARKAVLETSLEDWINHLTPAHDLL
jgi:hypothetical protein